MRTLFFSFTALSIITWHGFTLPAHAQASSQEPQSVITFTFDDAPKSVYQTAFPILHRYGIPATLYVITDVVGTDHWYVTWDQIDKLSKAGWEIGDHTNTHPSLIKLSNADVISELDISKQTLLQHGYRALSFAPPFGDYNEKVLSFIRERFQSNRKADGGVDAGFNDPLHPDHYNLSAYELQDTTTFSQAKARIDRAVKDGQWLIFFAHKVVKGEPAPYEYKAARLKKIVRYVDKLKQDRKIRVSTVKDVISNTL